LKKGTAMQEKKARKGTQKKKEPPPRKDKDKGTKKEST